MKSDKPIPALAEPAASSPPSLVDDVLWNGVFIERQKFIREWGRKQELGEIGDDLLDTLLSFWAEVHALAAPSQDAPLPEIKRLQAIIERDRTEVSKGVVAMRNVLQGREWLTEGRGPYEWNDDNWYKEFAAASDEMYEALKPLEKIAADLSDSPKTQIEVDAARRAAPSSARTDKDYAIEHGGYLADAAQAYLDEKNRYDAAVAGYGDEIPDTDSLTDHHQALRSRIYEFRKRAQKATERPSSAGPETPPTVWTELYASRLSFETFNESSPGVVRPEPTFIAVPDRAAE